ncbi:MAG: AAA family ATPase [Selenomonadaceae bacterium]|nr:AAA family ATPase [Selenomonadaceae bacterium]MBO6304443.1 AAA family ATPase [Selenomonadaceae bacterium]MBP3722587.1 AAA family ATPase [Selenomonadaceae bacterium]
MLFYECKVDYRFRARSVIQKQMKEKSKKEWGDDIFQDINDRLNEDSDEDKIAAIIYRVRPEYLNLLIISLSFDKITSLDIENLVKEKIVKSCQFSEIKINSLKEIVPAQAKKILEVADNTNYITYRCRLDRLFGADYNDFSLDYYTNREFNIDETLLPEKALTEKQAVAEAKRMMLHESFIDEIKRIYDKKNPKKFLGHPVHYKLLVNNAETAAQMAKFLCHMLYSNGRLLSRCISRIYDISESCYDEYDLENVFRKSAGSTIIIELRGSNKHHKNYASCYEEVVQYLAKLAKKNQCNTLFIFVEIAEHPGFAANLISELDESLYMIELKEGVGTRANALDYLRRLIKEKSDISYTEKELVATLGDKTAFRPSDVHIAFESLYRGGLRNKMYTAYKDVVCVKAPKLAIRDKDAYQSLQDMIGLTKVKEIVKQILSAAKIKKIRSDFGINEVSTSLHMVFTGNPGSAKTTVARLLAEILSHEGVLKSGKFVECGRADLVGKYVGWTAPAVEKQFRAAKGGILFIDEAYSLVDDVDGCFGDEAIHTIVQEMENHRDDTIVIFAGYPEKMEKFLAKNEGLRSRIAFHIDFPDYNEDELLGIFRLMLKKRGFNASVEVEEKCREIFAKASKQDEFGNGRFVRNLLEQAILKQSARLMNTFDKAKIEKKDVLMLLPEDFDVNITEQYKKTSNAMGFVV